MTLRNGGDDVYYEADYRPRRRAPDRGYGGGYGLGFRDRGYDRGYRGSWRERADQRYDREARLPRRPAHGFPPHAIHTYDLDYGSQAGGPGLYSGRAGYGPPDRQRGWWRTQPYDRWGESRGGRPHAGERLPDRGRRPVPGRHDVPRHWAAEEPSHRRGYGGWR